MSAQLTSRASKAAVQQYLADVHDLSLSSPLTSPPKPPSTFAPVTGGTEYMEAWSYLLQTTTWHADIKPTELDAAGGHLAHLLLTCDREQALHQRKVFEVLGRWASAHEVESGGRLVNAKPPWLPIAFFQAVCRGLDKLAPSTNGMTAAEKIETTVPSSPRAPPGPSLNIRSAVSQDGRNYQAPRSDSQFGLFIMNVPTDDAVLELFDVEIEAKIVRIYKYSIPTTRVAFFATAEDRDEAFASLPRDLRSRYGPEDRSRPLVKIYIPRESTDEYAATPGSRAEFIEAPPRASAAPSSSIRGAASQDNRNNEAPPASIPTAPEAAPIGLFMLNVSSDNVVRELFEPRIRQNITAIDTFNKQSTRIAYFASIEDRNEALVSLPLELKHRYGEPDRTRPLVQIYKPRENNPHRGGAARGSSRGDFSGRGRGDSREDFGGQGLGEARGGFRGRGERGRGRGGWGDAQMSRAASVVSRASSVRSGGVDDYGRNVERSQHGSISERHGSISSMGSASTAAAAAKPNPWAAFAQANEGKE